MTDNLKLWNAVCETDPKHTKPVTFGRTFTAIDPMYQIMNATKAMGVAGEGWGFSVVETLFLPTDQVAVKVRMWRGKPENYVEQFGQNKLYIDAKKSKADDDCMKKATTDGITKCLTYFGFNADIFLGKFDDNKYVKDMENKFDTFGSLKEAKAYADEHVEKLKDALKRCDDLQKWEKLDKWAKPHVEKLVAYMETISNESTAANFEAYIDAIRDPIITKNEQLMNPAPIEEKTDQEKLETGQY